MIKTLIQFQGIEMFFSKGLFVCLLTQFLFSTSDAQNRYDCYENACSKFGRCPEAKCEKGSRLIKNATLCGCCHACVIQLNEGDRCKTQANAIIPREECGPGLVCDKTDLKCTPADTQCIKDQKKWDSNEKIGIHNDKSRPECDEFGFYTPIVCIQNVLCYCVNKDGKRIFGTDVASNKEQMNCKCSRDYEEFPRKNSKVQNGDFLRCQSNGNYDALQCTEKYCYCMRNDVYFPGHEIKANTSLYRLPCYEKRLHGEDDLLLRSKCWHNRNTLLQKIKEQESKGFSVIGLDLPKCDLDGSYSSVQCKKSICYCVKKNGEQYEDFDYINRRDAKNLDCNCARDRDMLENYGNENYIKNYLKKYYCDKFGSFFINN